MYVTGGQVRVFHSRCGNTSIDHNAAHLTLSLLLLQTPEDSEWAYVSASDDDKADSDDEEEDDEDEEGTVDQRLPHLMQTGELLCFNSALLHLTRTECSCPPLV
jgi:hypothetical protein